MSQRPPNSGESRDYEIYRVPGNGDARMNRLNDMAKSYEVRPRNAAKPEGTSAKSGRWEESRKLRGETKDLIREQKSLISEIKKKSR